eukprot:1154279_1
MEDDSEALIPRNADREELIPSDGKAKKYNGICASCKWYNDAPLLQRCTDSKRRTFLLMLSFGLLTPVWMILRVTGTLTGDLVAGVSALILALYAANRFRILLRLKNEVGRYEKYNKAFKQENASLKKAVSRLGKANDQLKGVSDRLEKTSKAYEENIGKFRKLDQALGKLTLENIDGLKKIQEKARQVQQSIERERIGHQRDILMRIHETMEDGDRKEGLTQDEWHQFIGALPPECQDTFTQIDFKERTSGDDTMDLKEFTKLVDDILSNQ